MSKIRILPENLSNKIAAGEVIERPVSVVKELIENSIDAQSTKIIVDIKNGGKSLIRVSDNGNGMNRDDVLMSLERYATSKIKDSKDLFFIKTLGFRGEAIPSIASVSRFSMVVRDKNNNVGTKIEVNCGKIRLLAECGAPLGVMTTVKDLFLNIPVRRKFLKSNATETSLIADVLTSMAIMRPDISLKLISNGRVIKNWQAYNDPLLRIKDALGDDLSKKLLLLNATDNDLSVRGWIATPNVSRSTTRGIYVFVNGRYVKDKIIQHSLLSAYRGKLTKGKFPIAVIFVELPFNEVDVNVHPSKHEVHFANQERIHDFLNIAVIRTLGTLDYLKWNFPSSENVSGADFFISNNSNQMKDLDKILQTTNNKDKSNNEQLSNRPETCINDLLINKDVTAGIDISSGKTRLESSEQQVLWGKQFFSNLIIVGQYHGTYILCESNNSLVIIDQHAAHERILFEKLRSNAYKTKPMCQKSLLPELIEVDFTESKILEELIPHLSSYGLEIEAFGGNTFIVKTIPVFIDNSTVSALIIEMVEKTAKIGIKEDFEIIMRECLSVMACHASLRARQNLSTREIANILEQLDNCTNSSYCPHGRPTWIKLNLAELEKKFSRSV